MSVIISQPSGASYISPWTLKTKTTDIALTTTLTDIAELQFAIPNAAKSYHFQFGLYLVVTAGGLLSVNDSSTGTTTFLIGNVYSGLNTPGQYLVGTSYIQVTAELTPAFVQIHGIIQQSVVGTLKFQASYTTAAITLKAGSFLLVRQVS